MDRNGITLTDTEGNAMIICGVHLVNNKNSCGYHIEVDLTNGKARSVLGDSCEENLTDVRDVIAASLRKNLNVDLRKSTMA
jgi:hypothetical protein